MSTNEKYYAIEQTDLRSDDTRVYSKGGVVPIFKNEDDADRLSYELCEISPDPYDPDLPTAWSVEVDKNGNGSYIMSDAVIRFNNYDEYSRFVDDYNYYVDRYRRAIDDHSLQIAFDEDASDNITVPVMGRNGSFIPGKEVELYVGHINDNISDVSFNYALKEFIHEFAGAALRNQYEGFIVQNDDLAKYASEEQRRLPLEYAIDFETEDEDSFDDDGVDY